MRQFSQPPRECCDTPGCSLLYGHAGVHFIARKRRPPDVLDPAGFNNGNEDGSVFLYELYTDQAAVDAHMGSALLASTRGSYDDMITSKRVVWCAVT